MGRIGVHEFTTIDGVIAAPMWTMDYEFDPRMGQAISGLMSASRTILLGRTTYQEFGPAWSSRTAEEDPGAPFMNDTPKYVVSSTLTEETADWGPVTLLGRYDADTIRAFRDGIDGGIYVSGSGTLVRALLADGLVDELHLYVFPIAVGEGQRLFPDGAPRTPLRLLGCEYYPSEVVHLIYGPA